MKLVIDTNVFIDGDLDDNSYANKIVDEILNGRIQVFANPATVREYGLILQRLVKNKEYRAKLRSCFGKVNLVPEMRIEAEIVDPEDNKILASAVTGQVQYLVTSDSDLLSLKEYGGIPIVPPADFWAVYKEKMLGENDWEKFVTQFFKD